MKREWTIEAQTHILYDAITYLTHRWRLSPRAKRKGSDVAADIFEDHDLMRRIAPFVDDIRHAEDARDIDAYEDAVWRFVWAGCVICER
jgi:hypothetical protein